MCQHLEMANVNYPSLDRLPRLNEMGRHLQDRQMIEVSLPVSLVQQVDIAPLASALTSASMQSATQHAGDAWLTEASSPALQVTSSIITEEPNYVLNPNHPQFDRIKIGTSKPFAFDPRLTGQK
jgi:RES domain-containing protein